MPMKNPPHSGRSIRTACPNRVSLSNARIQEYTSYVFHGGGLPTVVLNDRKQKRYGGPSAFIEQSGNFLSL